MHGFLSKRIAQKSILDGTENVLASLENHGMDIVRRGLVSIVIEKTLLDFDPRAYYKVIDELKKRYGCYLPDCYEHPEYLNFILKDLYGVYYRHIVKSITEQLEEFSYQQPIAKFIESLNQ